MSEDDAVMKRLQAGLSDAEREVAAYAAQSKEGLRAAAIHEAGHGVVGALGGERIGDIVLCHPRQGTEWGGLTVREPDSATISQQVEAALAGDAAEGLGSFERDAQKAMAVAGSYNLEDADADHLLDGSWRRVQAIVATQAEVISSLVNHLLRGESEMNKHRRMAGEEVRAVLGELLDHEIGAPAGGDSEPCGCHVPEPMH